MSINIKIIACLLAIMLIGVVVPIVRAQTCGNNAECEPTSPEISSGFWGNFLDNIQIQISIVSQKIGLLFQAILGIGQTYNGAPQKPGILPNSTTGATVIPETSGPEKSSVTGCILKDNSCCTGDKCAAANLSCDNGYAPFLDGCDAACQPIVRCEAPCVDVGGDIFDASKDKCCSGLTAVNGTYHVNGTCMKDLGTICVKCGDGICEGPENDCNCPRDCKVKPVCAKEGEIFSDGSRQCCAGLQKDYSIKPCSDGKVPCRIFPLQFSCKKPSSLTCGQECKSKGYASGYCGGKNGCKENDSQSQEYDIGQFGCMNLPAGTTENNLDQLSWSACCCSGLNENTCVKENGIIAGNDLDSVCCAGLDKVQTMSGSVCKKPGAGKDCADDGELVYNDSSMFGAVGGPKKCCDPEAGVRPEFFSDGGAAKGTCIKGWNKTCGNGKCDALEDTMSCPWDCKNNTTSTCDDLCGNSGYGAGRCVSSASSDPKCAAGETDMGIGMGQSDCNLYGQPKTAGKTCCCKPRNPNHPYGCIEKGGSLGDTMKIGNFKQCCPGLMEQFASGSTEMICAPLPSVPQLPAVAPAVLPNFTPSSSLVSCALKNNYCDWGTGSMTYDCSDKGGGNFVISGCDKLCQPYGKCVNPSGKIVAIPAQSP